MTHPHYIDREAETFLPCPFCGSVPERVGAFSAQCRGMVNGKEVHNTIVMNNAAWNRRPAPMEAVAWREKVEIVTEWLAMAETCTASNSGIVRFVPVCKTEIDAIRSILQALAVIPTQGLGSSAAPIPTEWSERPEVVLQYAQQVATYAAKRVGCVDEWRPLEDVYGCLTQIDNCLTGLVAKQGGETQ